jgi:hypothetical protein
MGKTSKLRAGNPSQAEPRLRFPGGAARMATKDGCARWPRSWNCNGRSARVASTAIRPLRN